MKNARFISFHEHKIPTDQSGAIQMVIPTVDQRLSATPDSNAARPVQLIIKTAAFAVFIAISLLLSGCEKYQQYQLDAQVRELCEKDGGITVYETVMLPADKFDRWGGVNFYFATRKENALGPEYLFKESIHYYHKGEHADPRLTRYINQIFRRSDEKLLGQSIGYSRRGGDLLSPPFQPSSFRCPDDFGGTVLLELIFKKISSKEGNNE